MSGFFNKTLRQSFKKVESPVSVSIPKDNTEEMTE